MKPSPMKPDDIQRIVARAIDDAVAFVDAEIAPQRIRAQRYFDGRVDIGHEAGRSKVVATKVRDTIRAIKPSLMRVFLSHAKPVEFVPRKPQDVAAAEQATDYIHWLFNENRGFRLLNDVFHDAALKKVGILKAYYEEYPDVDIDEYTGLTDDEWALVASDPEVEIMEHTAREGTTPMGPVMLHDAKVSREKTRGEISIESVPPEEFFVDPSARNLEDCYVCGHRTEMRVGDLVQMGFDFDDVADLAGKATLQGDEEDLARRGYDADEETAGDPSMRRIVVTEAYMKMDVEGTGIPRMYSFLCAGEASKVLRHELCDEVPFAVFEVDPEPHAFFGRSIADLIMNDQDAATSMLRSVLDNVALNNMPRLIVNDSRVNMDDVLNNEIGGIIRVQDVGAITPIVVPFAAGATLPALQYFDDQVESKTGVSRASAGLDPDALQNSTATAVAVTMGAAAGQVEVIARNLAEGGMRQLFRLLLRLVCKHVEPGEMMRLNGRFVPVDPRGWNVHMDLIANVGLGTGAAEEKKAVLREALGYQQQIWGTYGPSNGLVTMTQIRNTFADILAASGIHNADRYINLMDPETEQMLLQQAAEAAQAQQGGASDPAQAILQAEQVKAQTRAQTDMMRLQLEAQKFAAQHARELSKDADDDDFRRDKLLQELFLKAAQIVGAHDTAVDVAAVRQMQQATQPY